MILSCQNLSKSFGSDDIIKNVSFQINEGDKVAIVGNNGAGKSTLLKMITGELDTDAGTVVFAKDTTIGYLAQYQNMEGNETVYQTVYSSRTDILEMQKNLQKMEEQMTKLTDDALDALLVRYHEMHDVFDHMKYRACFVDLVFPKRIFQRRWICFPVDKKPVYLSEDSLL